MNPAAWNLQLSAGSPAIDSADSLAPGEQTLDILGNPRVDDPLVPNTGNPPGSYYDRGAYEYQPPATQSPTASDESASTDEATPVDVTLQGSSSSVCELMFSVVSGPAHGSIGSIVDHTCTHGSPNTDTETVTYTSDPGYTGADTFTYEVNDGTSDSNTATVSITVNMPPAVRVDAGGAAYTDSSGNSWAADCCNSGGNVYKTAASIAGTSDPTLYQSERWAQGPFSYTFIGLAAGNYAVTLKFAEIAGYGPGKRQFNVSIQGTQVLTNFDVAAQAGLNTALDKTFTASVDSSGQLKIDFTQGAANNPIVSAIQIVPVVGSLSFAGGPQSLTAGQPSAAMQVGVSAAQASDLPITLSSSSPNGGFATSPGGPFNPTLAVTIPAGQTTSGSFYYKDTAAGNPTLSAKASGFAKASQTETVSAAPLAEITVTPANATVPANGNQPFTATGADTYGNPVSVSSATWTTTAPGTVSPGSGSATTFTAGSTPGNGSVTATIGSVNGSASVTVTSGLTTFRVDAGGAAYTDSSGNSWAADCCNSGGNVYKTAASIAGTSDPTLYQSERWAQGPFSYTFIGLAAGNYAVTLKFAEIAGYGPGKRQFNVSIQGTQVLTNFDVAAQAGLNTALDKTFTATVDTSGQLKIDFTQGAANNPIVSAIQIVPAS